MIIEWFQIFRGPDFWLTVLLGAQIGGRMPTVTHPHPEPLPPSVHSQPCFQNSCLGQFFWLRYIRTGMFENGWKIFIIPSLKWSWFYCLRNSRNQPWLNQNTMRCPCDDIYVRDSVLIFKQLFTSAVLHSKHVSQLFDHLSIKRWNLIPFFLNMVLGMKRRRLRWYWVISETSS